MVITHTRVPCSYLAEASRQTVWAGSAFRQLFTYTFIHLGVIANTHTVVVLISL